MAGAIRAYQDAWFYSRVFFYEIGLSVSTGQNRSGIHTGWWRTNPGPFGGNPADPLSGARWDEFPDKCGTFLQDYVSGTGARPLWFDYTGPSGLALPVKGPFGYPSMFQRFKTALWENSLPQTKPRLRVMAYKNGEKVGPLLLRVPHR